MSLVDAPPLRQVSALPDPAALYAELMALIMRLARHGLIHGDFNEFNILIRRDTGEPVVIDFPQMVSTSHKNAEWYVHRGSLGRSTRLPNALNCGAAVSLPVTVSGTSTAT